MRYIFTWEFLLVLCVIAWILLYRHAVRMMNYYREVTDDLHELFHRYDSIVAGEELDCPKELTTEMFWVYYDPNRLDRFFFALDCCIGETDKIYDKLVNYCCFFGKRRWEDILAMHSANQYLKGRLGYLRWRNGLLSAPQE